MYIVCGKSAISSLLLWYMRIVEKGKAMGAVEEQLQPRQLVFNITSSSFDMLLSP